MRLRLILLAGLAVPLALSPIGCGGSSSRPDELAGRIAFVGHRDRVFTVDAADSTLTRIGRSPGSGRASWSPDGTTLAYSNPDGVIVVAKVPGDGESRLPRPFENTRCYDPVYSPDGSLLACDLTEPWMITVVDAGDGALVGRTPDCCYHPAWSPDGRRIAYISFGTFNRKVGEDGTYVGPAGIFVMNADGTHRRLVVRTNVDLQPSPAWSSRDSIAFIGGDGAISTVDAAGTGLRRIVPLAEARPEGGLAWSPDGAKLAFQGGDGDYEIFVVNADGSGLTNLTNNDRIQDESPSWSPDGQAITFVSSRDEGPSQVFAMRADGSGQTQLTHDDGWSACCPAWSPAR